MKDIRQVTLALSAAGRELVLGPKPYPIESISGLESTDYELTFADNANLPGSTLVGQRAGKRPISIRFDLPSTPEFARHRQELIRFFRPDIAGELLVDYNGLQRKIPYVIEEFRFQNSNLYEQLRAQLDLLCPQPFFLDLNNYGKNIAAKTPLYGFPLWIHRTRGFAMGYRTLKKHVSLPNEGDVDTGIEIVFKAARGTVTNPKLEKVSTGEFVQVMVEMQQGDILHVNTNPGQKRIELNGENLFHRKSRLSQFFQITVGDNVLKYDADENYTNLDVTLYYIPKYLGV